MPPGRLKREQRRLEPEPLDSNLVQPELIPEQPHPDLKPWRMDCPMIRRILRDTQRTQGKGLSAR
jgi:hypothetical protein